MKFFDDPSKQTDVSIIFQPEIKDPWVFPTTSGLQAFGDNIWIADGPNARDMGFWFTTRMTIIKLADGSLWVDSPVPVSFDVLKQITELGTIKYLVAATPRHVWRLERWHTLFPEAQLWISRPTIMTLKKGELPLTGVLGDNPIKEWANDLDQLTFKGNPIMDEVVFYHKESQTVVLDDLIQIHLNMKDHLFQNALMKIEGVKFPYGGVGLEIKLSFINRKLARSSLKKLLSWDFDKLIIAHGMCIVKGARAFVEQSFRWLVP